MKYRQTLGEAYFGKRPTMNPLPAAAMLLSQYFGRTGARRVKRALVGRRRLHRGNPLPAVAGILGAGLPKLGQRVDPKKHAARRAAIDQQAALAMAGSTTAMENLARIAQGLAWPGGWADLAAYAGQHLALVQQKLEALETKRGAVSAAAERRAAAAAARESRFLEAGTAIGSAIGQAALSRGRRLPRRRRRPRY